MIEVKIQGELFLTMKRNERLFLIQDDKFTLSLTLVHSLHRSHVNFLHITVILFSPRLAFLTHKKSPKTQNNSWHASHRMQRLIDRSGHVYS